MGIPRNKSMIYYIDIRFEIEADSQQEAADIVTREIREMYGENYGHGISMSSIITDPYIICIMSKDSAEYEEFDVDDLNDSIKEIDDFDLYKALHNTEEHPWNLSL